MEEKGENQLYQAVFWPPIFSNTYTLISLKLIFKLVHVHLFTCVCLWAQMHTDQKCCCQVPSSITLYIKRKIMIFISFVCGWERNMSMWKWEGLHGSNSGCQAWQEVPLPDAPSCQLFSTLLLFWKQGLSLNLEYIDSIFLGWLAHKLQVPSSLSRCWDYRWTLPEPDLYMGAGIQFRSLTYHFRARHSGTHL